MNNTAYMRKIMNDGGKGTTQVQMKNCCKRKNLVKGDERSTKVAVEGSAQGTEPAVLNSVGVLEYKFVFALIQNEPELKLQFMFFTLPMAFLCLLH